MFLRTLGLVLLALTAALPARAFETLASAAWVYDLTTRTVLMDKNASTPLPPASMSKLMTINMLFEALRDGRVNMDTTFAVSSRAREMTALGGSTMYLQESDRPTVDELIRGIIVNSGNDACIVVAEGLAGSEQAFAAQMTERGRAIGLEASTFTNASGWPDPNHRMSMRDLGILSARLIEEFPEYYPMFAETEFNYKGLFRDMPQQMPGFAWMRRACNAVGFGEICKIDRRHQQARWRRATSRTAAATAPCAPAPSITAKRGWSLASARNPARMVC